MKMVKEHFIEAYGVPKVTIGWALGGLVPQHQIADNFQACSWHHARPQLPDLEFGTAPW
jgi:hypothetical protein